MLHIKAFSSPILVALLVAFSGCGRSPGSASAQSSKDQNDQITQLKEKLGAAIREKNAEKFIDCFFIEERFNTADVREINRKQAEAVFGRETTTAIETEEISDKDMAEIRKIQNAKPDTAPRYSLLPKKMILLRQKSESGIAGRRFLIGERNGQWYIVTMAGYAT